MRALRLRTPLSIEVPGAACRAFEIDANEMVRWARLSDFASASLWLGPIPDLFDHSIQRFINWLVHQEGQHWQAWTSWCLRRLEGRPVNCELESARALELTEEEWVDTAHANCRLLEIEHRFAGIDEALADGTPGDGEAAEPPLYRAAPRLGASTLRTARFTLRRLSPLRKIQSWRINSQPQR